MDDVYVTVVLPKRLLGWMSKKFFPMDAWQFFFDIMETMANERSNSPQVQKKNVKFFIR